MYDWLIEAFGFEKHAAYYSEDGKTLLHGELRMGDSFVMLGSAEGNEFGRLVSPPAELGGTTASPYIATDDIDARCERAAQGRSRDLHGADRPALWQPRLHLQGSRKAMSGASAPIGRAPAPA